MKTITVYTTNNCAYCLQVKGWLKSKGLPYEEINVEERPERQTEMTQLSGQMAVPVVVVHDSETERDDVTVGRNLAKLAAAVRDIPPEHIGTLERSTSGAHNAV